MALLTYMLDQSIPCQPSHWTRAPILVSLLTSKNTIKLLMQLVSVSAYNCYPLMEAGKSVRQVIIACRKCTMIQWGPHVHGSTWVFILPPPHSEKKKYATLSQESAMPAKAHSHRYKLQPKNRSKTNQKRRKEPLPNLKSCLYRWKLVGVHELRCWHILKAPYAQATYQIMEEELDEWNFPSCSFFHCHLSSHRPHIFWFFPMEAIGMFIYINSPFWVLTLCLGYHFYVHLGKEFQSK